MSPDANLYFYLGTVLLILIAIFIAIPNSRLPLTTAPRRSANAFEHTFKGRYPCTTDDDCYTTTASTCNTVTQLCDTAGWCNFEKGLVSLTVVKDNDEDDNDKSNTRQEMCVSLYPGIIDDSGKPFPYVCRHGILTLSSNMHIHCQCDSSKKLVYQIPNGKGKNMVPYCVQAESSLLEPGFYAPK
jgi:hypothetical protein